MPSSDVSSASSSSVEIIAVSDYAARLVDPISARAPAGTNVVDAKDSDEDDNDTAPSWLLPGRYISTLCTQESLDNLCKKYSIPDGFRPYLAGDRRACSSPPPGAVCVYAHALEAGMRVPLHAFFCAVLGHFGLAPSQLAPNGWRILVGFVVLCHFAGVPPSLAVFLHFFSLCIVKRKAWYSFRCKDANGILFTGLLQSIKGWKEAFFFLSWTTPWPCPVQWGEPCKSATLEPVLTSDDKDMAAKLLRAHGAAVDIKTYICDRNLAAAKVTRAPPPPSCHSTSPIVRIDPAVYDLIKNIRAEKAAAQAAAEKVTIKSEGDSDAPPWRSTLSWKKRKLAEDDSKDGSSRSELNTPSAAYYVGGGAGCSAPGECRPPGFSAPKPPKSDQYRKPWNAPDGHDGDTADWTVARQLLQGIVTPSRESTFAAANPSNIVFSSYISFLQAVNYVSFSLDYALELEEKVRATERELGRVEAELVEAKKAAAVETKNAKAAAVQESKEYVRRLAEHALQGYERGMEDMRRVALHWYPYLEAARLVVPPEWYP